MQLKKQENLEYPVLMIAAHNQIYNSKIFRKEDESVESAAQRIVNEVIKMTRPPF